MIQNKGIDFKMKRILALGLAICFIFTACKGTDSKEAYVTIGDDIKPGIENLIDFTVNIKDNKQPIILQLTDTQIIDSAQQRTTGSLKKEQAEYWATENIDECCFDYLKEIITETKPDLIIITGDIIQGEFDDKGTSLLKFVEFMEGFKIPWAPIFGNHENESKRGADWQCEQFENAKYCLFKQRELTGNGNYSIGITQNNKLLRVFYMLDSNGCTNASEESLANSHTVKSAGIASDQREWYKESIKELKVEYPNVKISFAFHIPSVIFSDAFAKYTNSRGGRTRVYIDNVDEKGKDDFGFIGADIKGEWDSENFLWNDIKEYSVDSVFVGHEHANSASVVYEGVRFQYGQKSSTYHRLNWSMSNGKIVTSYPPSKNNTPLVGGTVIPLDNSGAISKPYIYYCKDAGGQFKISDFK